MTFNGVMAVILRHFTKFSSLGATYVTAIATEMSPKSPVFDNIRRTVIFSEISDKSALKTSALDRERKLNLYNTAQPSLR